MAKFREVSVPTKEGNENDSSLRTVREGKIKKKKTDISVTLLKATLERKNEKEKKEIQFAIGEIHKVYEDMLTKIKKYEDENLEFVNLDFAMLNFDPPTNPINKRFLSQEGIKSDDSYNYTNAKKHLEEALHLLSQLKETDNISVIHNLLDSHAQSNPENIFITYIQDGLEGKYKTLYKVFGSDTPFSNSRPDTPLSSSRPDTPFSNGLGTPCADDFFDRRDKLSANNPFLTEGSTSHSKYGETIYKEAISYDSEQSFEQFSLEEMKNYAVDKYKDLVYKYIKKILELHKEDEDLQEHIADLHKFIETGKKPETGPKIQYIVDEKTGNNIKAILFTNSEGKNIVCVTNNVNLLRQEVRLKKGVIDNLFRKGRQETKMLLANKKDNKPRWDIIELDRATNAIFKGDWEDRLTVTSIKDDEGLKAQKACELRIHIYTDMKCSLPFLFYKDNIYYISNNARDTSKSFTTKDRYLNHKLIDWRRGQGNDKSKYKDEATGEIYYCLPPEK